MYHGQWNPPVDEVLLRNYFSTRVTPGVLLECGACDGVLGASGLFFEESLNWQCINLEPSPDTFALLARNRPLAINLPYALHMVTGPVNFMDVVAAYNHEGYGEGSLGISELHQFRLYQRQIPTRTTTVHGITYFDLLTTLTLSELNLMVLDIEGGEIEVLRSMRGAPILPQVLCVEYPLHNWAELLTTVADLGLSFDFASYNNAFFSATGPLLPDRLYGNTGIMTIPQIEAAARV